MVKRILMLVLFMSTFLYSKQCTINSYIPENAFKYLDTVYKEVKQLLPNYEYPWYFPALIEQESCVVLCGKGYWAKRCWNPSVRLKTKREEGAGLFQITRVFTKTGRVRWDMLYTLKRRYPKYLSKLTWKNIYKRPDLQILAGILLWRSNYRYYNKIPNELERTWFADSAFNGGFKYLNYERSKCKLLPNCNPDKWFNNVERVKSKRARRKLYGNRTAWDINRAHVKNVKIRMNKYKTTYVLYSASCE